MRRCTDDASRVRMRALAGEVGLLGVDEALAEELLVVRRGDEGWLVVPHVCDASVGRRTRREGSFEMIAVVDRGEEARVAPLLLRLAYLGARETLIAWHGKTDGGSFVAMVNGDRQNRVGERYSLPWTVDLEEVRQVARQNSKASFDPTAFANVFFDATLFIASARWVACEGPMQHATQCSYTGQQNVSASQAAQLYGSESAVCGRQHPVE
eukprot:CAMPEP_0180361622 /NCGR_PEP_ID=MMETSP0989-20121125/12766_1 /TAXON_ID=697907 /ORGANISM="non described non described, Strain CCMP2293" /LENGTH=210 /DNA_ID=CAMNT_0022353355 /DNA_START=238 /DNA_END=872 /DNA_ORIENTATION=+